MIPAACGYAGGRFIWFAGDRVRWMVDKRLNTKKASDYSEAFNSVELRGFEPLTFSLRTRRATNCAIAPQAKTSVTPVGGTPEREGLLHPCRAAASEDRVHSGESGPGLFVPARRNSVSGALRHR